MLPQTRFHASGSPGTVFEVPGDSSQRRRQAILTRLSAKAAPGLTKRARLLIKRTIGDTKHTIPLETVSKSSAGADKTHDTVNKKSDRRHKTYDSVRDCQQNERSEAIWRDLGRRSQIPRNWQGAKSLIKSFVKCCRKNDFMSREAQGPFSRSREAFGHHFLIENIMDFVSSRSDPYKIQYKLGNQL